MAITQALCSSYKKELLWGIHHVADEYKIALFTRDALLNAATEIYNPKNEVEGDGYTAGGKFMNGIVIDSVNTTAWIDWTVDPSWDYATITARGALIYNATQDNRAVAVLDFGTDKSSTNGTFTAVLPVGGPLTAIIRLT